MCVLLLFQPISHRRFFHSYLIKLSLSLSLYFPIFSNLFISHSTQFRSTVVGWMPKTSKTYLLSQYCLHKFPHFTYQYKLKWFCLRLNKGWPVAFINKILNILECWFYVCKFFIRWENEIEFVHMVRWGIGRGYINSDFFMENDVYNQSKMSERCIQ